MGKFPHEPDPNGQPADSGDGASDAAARRDAELLALATAAVAGDRAALNRLLRLIDPVITKYCRARMNGRWTGMRAADDVAQEVCLAVCSALPRFRYDGTTPFLAFVYAIAANKVADAFRAAGRDRSLPSEALPEDADPNSGPEDSAVLADTFGRANVLLDRLPAQQREILVLRIALQFSAEETARTVGSSPGAVRVAQHRALIKLRSWAGELG